MSLPASRLPHDSTILPRSVRDFTLNALARASTIEEKGQCVHSVTWKKSHQRGHDVSEERPLVHRPRESIGFTGLLLIRPVETRVSRFVPSYHVLLFCSAWRKSQGMAPWFEPECHFSQERRPNWLAPPVSIHMEPPMAAASPAKW